MPFHVVQTIEQGKQLLFVCPNSWVKDNFVYWPPSGGNELMKDEHSQPHANWRKTRCTVKRANIDTFALADEMRSVMVNESDSDNHSCFESTSGMKLTKIISQNTQNQAQVTHHTPTAFGQIGSNVSLFKNSQFLSNVSQDNENFNL